MTHQLCGAIIHKLRKGFKQPRFPPSLPDQGCTPVPAGGQLFRFPNRISEHLTYPHLYERPSDRSCVGIQLLPEPPARLWCGDLEVSGCGKNCSNLSKQHFLPALPLVLM